MTVLIAFLLLVSFSSMRTAARPAPPRRLPLLLLCAAVTAAFSSYRLVL